MAELILIYLCLIIMVIEVISAKFTELHLNLCAKVLSEERSFNVGV